MCSTALAIISVFVCCRLCSIRRANSARRIQHAASLFYSKINCKLETRSEDYDGDVDADAGCELEATDTCSPRTCCGEAQSQRQLASEWRCWLR